MQVFRGGALVSGLARMSDPGLIKEIIASFKKPGDNVSTELLAELDKNRLIRRVSDPQWTSADSNEGKTILKEAEQLSEEGKTVFYCLPKFSGYVDKSFHLVEC